MNDNLPSIMVPLRAGPIPKFTIRPPIEETGHGNLLWCDGFASRFFRASKSWVQHGCDQFIERNKTEYCSWADLHDYWNIHAGDFDGWYGRVPSNDEDYGEPIEFTITECGPGTNFYEQFGETVYLIEPTWDTQPFNGFLEM